MRFVVGIVGIDTHPHARCFEDFARGIADALRTLGHEVVPATTSGARIVMFGANNFRSAPPADAIVYNPEQVAAKQQWNLMQGLGHYRQNGNVVWDYSIANVAWLRERGLRAVHCPVGYISSMTKIAPAPAQDIDVLFYGSVNLRRRAILDAIRESGLNLQFLFGVYGEERDRIIARSKVVLNLHYYEEPVFEIFRVSHLLANRVCVVTEDGGQDAVLEDFARRSCAYVSRERIVEECRHLCVDAAVREEVAARGHEEFKKIDLVENVRRALEQS